VITRRAALTILASAAAGRALPGQEPQPGLRDTSNLFAMDQSASRSVRLPAKPGAAPSMSAEQRDDLEHRIRCQCGCTLDVFTCRTTDFSCQVSPAMHRDIMALVQGGYSAPEILAAFENVYGERVLMAPRREGFNVVGYLLPSFAIAVGAVALAVMLRRWRRPAPSAILPTAPAVQATPEELRRLEAAVRDDS
jgi:cytochrome c-type biogenesis protein CcmH